jgi:nickel-dependent lactate racemase
MVSGRGSTTSVLSRDEVRDILREGLPRELYRGRKVLVLTPDGTRTAPLPLMVGEVQDLLGRSAKRLDFMVALGSHRPLSEEELLDLYGIGREDRLGRFAGSSFLNHRWDIPGTLEKIGVIESDEVDSLTGGLFRESVTIDLNARALDYDLLLILGPVFPHEVAGFSGGNKYLFPGISGGEFLHFFHWVAALITCWEIIGRKGTTVRRLVDRAAGFVPVERQCAAMVVTKENRLAGLWVGNPEEAWDRAADLSENLHIVRKPHPFRIVVGRAAGLYDELWTAGKVMYKLEPVVEDGGELIILGSHVRRISHTWGSHIERIGYHVRDYFLENFDRFRDVPKAVIAHSTHVKGLGTCVEGVERPRIEVVLATSIPEQLCRRINLEYRNPGKMRIEDFQNREDEGVLFVDDAGETLHRLEAD